MTKLYGEHVMRFDSEFVHRPYVVRPSGTHTRLPETFRYTRKVSGCSIFDKSIIMMLR